MDGRSRLHEDSVTASASAMSEREARLWRRLDIMRAERPDGADAENVADGGPGLRWWRGLGLVLAGGIGLTAAVVVFVHHSGPRKPDQGAPHQVDAAMPVPPAADTVAVARQVLRDSMRDSSPKGSAESAPPQSSITETRETEPPAAVASAPAQPAGPATPPGTDEAAAGTRPAGAQASAPTHPVAPAAPGTDDAAAGTPSAGAQASAPAQPVAPAAPGTEEAAAGTPPAGAQASAPSQAVAPAAPATDEAAADAPSAGAQASASNQPVSPAAPGTDDAAAGTPPTSAQASAPTQPVAPATPGTDDIAAGTPPAGAQASPSPPPATQAAPTNTAEAAAGAQGDEPALLVYYPPGSPRSEARARSLAAQIGSNVTNADVRAGNGPPDHALIRFSGERNHTLARMIGRTLGDARYHWKIESGASRGNTIEVWLPAR